MPADLIVIGAGPAGLMAAGTAARNGHQVVVLEKNDRPGRKLRITGKGRCNVTNDCEPQDVIAAATANGRFLYSCVQAFSPADTMAFFEAQGVQLKTERGNRVFPISDHAQDIVDALAGFCKDAGVRFCFGCDADQILTEDGVVTGVHLKGGKSPSGAQCFDCLRRIFLCGHGFGWKRYSPCPQAWAHDYTDPAFFGAADFCRFRLCADAGAFSAKCRRACRRHRFRERCL